ncbi:MAG: hypothetical protein ACE5J3_10260 [Methanosarcinales archaeon]
MAEYPEPSNTLNLAYLEFIKFRMPISFQVSEEYQKCNLQYFMLLPIINLTKYYLNPKDANKDIPNTYKRDFKLELLGPIRVLRVLH